MKKSVFLLAAALLLLWASAACAESTAVMVYMCGSNLESLYGSATKDIQEMLLSGLDAQETQVFIMTGGSRAWADSTISAEETRIYTLSPKAHGGGLKMKLLNASENRNLGEAETLSCFLNFCAEYGEADRRALILWDHGGGPVNGVCWDENFGTDHLSLDEITTALSNSPYAENKLEWIGFDACLMSSVEVASKLSPYAKYMISSQAEEPASGWDYSFLKGLENDAGGGATGQRIIDAFFAVKHRYNPDLTLSCVDLSAVAEIEESMNGLYAGMASRLNKDTFSALSKLRFKATGYGKSPEEARSSNGYDLVDIASLTESYASLDPEGAKAVEEAVQNAVLYNRSNVPGSCGLSVYHPYRNQSKFTSEWKQNYEKLNFCPGYTAYVNAYGQIMTGAHMVRWNGLNDIHASGDGSVITLNITEEQAENLASARLVVLARNYLDVQDDAYFHVFSTAEVSQSGTLLSARYDGAALTARNEGGQTAATGALSYRVNEDGLYQIALYPEDEAGYIATVPIMAEYTLSGGGVLALKGYAVYDGMTGAYSRRADVDLTQYPRIHFEYEYRLPTANEAGEYAAFDDWEADAHRNVQLYNSASTDDPHFLLTFSAGMATAEELWAAYELTDTQGNTYMTSLTRLAAESIETYEASFTLPQHRAEDIPVALSGAAVTIPAKENASPLAVVLVAVENKTDEPFLVGVANNLLDGQDAKLFMVSRAEDGTQIVEGRPTLLPKGTHTFLFQLEAEDLAALGPYTELPQVGFSLRLYRVQDEITPAYIIPVRVTAGVPLDILYRDADALPPQALVQAQGTGAPLLANYGDCSVWLEGLFTVDRSLVLLLRAENNAGTERGISLGAALLDGQAARMGHKVDDGLEHRNNAVRAFGLDAPLWDEAEGAYLYLPAGARQYAFVTVAPLSQEQAQARRLSFQGCIFDGSNTLNMAYFDSVDITAASPVALREGQSAAVPAAAYTVTPGRAVTPENRGAVADGVLTLDTGSRQILYLAEKAPEGEQFAYGYYELFRRVRSAQEAAEMNLKEFIDVERFGEFSFADGREWLVHEAYGDAGVRGGGKTIYALHPTLRPILCAGRERMPWGFYAITINEEAFDQNETMLFEFDLTSKYGMRFFDADLPGAPRFYALGNVQLTYDWFKDAAALTGYDELGSFDYLGNLASQVVDCMPLDVSGEDLAAFLTSNGNAGLASAFQYQYLYGGPIQFGLEAVTNLEDYFVTFSYRNTAGEWKCTPLRPISDFRSIGNLSE